MIARGWSWAKSSLLGLVRDPEHQVILTPDKIGVGNFLYIWMQVMIKRDRGLSASATRTPPMDEWLEQFPAVRELLVERSEISFRASRLHGYYQAIPHDYSADDVSSFCRRFLLGGSPFERLVGRNPSEPGVVVINVRRGDYYSNPTHRGNYSFDVVEYVRAAVAQSRESAPITEFVVVSDDIAWCRVKLAWLVGEAPVTWFDEPGGPPAHLARLAGASRLILANSTFSYWGGYLAQARDPSAKVVAPWFHARHMGGGRLFHALPSWSLVESIPGGWDG